MIICHISNHLFRGLLFLIGFMPFTVFAEFYNFEILGRVFPMVMNNHGQVVGVTLSGSAFLWDSTCGIREIGPCDQIPSIAYYINDSGDILGRSILPWVILDDQVAYTASVSIGASSG